MKPLTVEIITFAPTEFYQCNRCEVVFNETDAATFKKFREDARQTSMPSDMMRDYQALCDWIFAADERYTGRVVFKVVDAASVEGLLKSVRFGIRKYPAIIVDGKEKRIGTDFKQFEAAIDRRLALA